MNVAAQGGREFPRRSEEARGTLRANRTCAPDGDVAYFLSYGDVADLELSVKLQYLESDLTLPLNGDRGIDGIARRCGELPHFTVFVLGGCAGRLVSKLERRAHDRDGISACSEAFAIFCDRRRDAFDDVVRSDVDTL